MHSAASHKLQGKTGFLCFILLQGFFSACQIFLVQVSAVSEILNLFLNVFFSFFPLYEVNSYKCRKIFFFLIPIFSCVYQKYDRCFITGLTSLRRWDFHLQRVMSISVKDLRCLCYRNKCSLAFMSFPGTTSYFSCTYADLMILRHYFQKVMVCV